jgi:hypothetical protein
LRRAVEEAMRLTFASPESALRQGGGGMRRAPAAVRCGPPPDTREQLSAAQPGAGTCYRPVASRAKRAPTRKSGPRPSLSALARIEGRP